jgi:phage terminase small subunit
MTGSRGPVSKPDGRRQRRNKPKTPLVLGKGMKKPKAPSELLEVTVDRWNEFWKTDLAKTMRVENLPMIERLFMRYDERERAVRVIRKDGRLTLGSQGQLVLHPLLKHINDCESAIVRDEDRLGISPNRRVGTGSAGGAGVPGSLDDLNARLNGDEEATERDNEDPRDQVVGAIGR